MLSPPCVDVSPAIRRQQIRRVDLQSEPLVRRTAADQQRLASTRFDVPQLARHRRSGCAGTILWNRKARDGHVQAAELPDADGGEVRHHRGSRHARPRGRTPRDLRALHRLRSQESFLRAGDADPMRAVHSLPRGAHRAA